MACLAFAYAQVSVPTTSKLALEQSGDLTGNRTSGFLGDSGRLEPPISGMTLLSSP